MSYFLSSQNLSIGQEIDITGEEARHILLARRVKKGETISLQGPDRNRFLAEAIKVSNGSLAVKVTRQVEVPKEPQTKVSLYQAVVSEKALDFILQKCTELGAYKIALFNSANTATKLSREQFDKKVVRWQKILWEAAKQCDRSQVPELEFVGDLRGVAVSAAGLDALMVLDAAAKETLKTEILNEKPKIAGLGLVVGPEGGLTLGEIDSLKVLSNFHLARLGGLILRAETAALAALAVSLMLLE